MASIYRNFRIGITEAALTAGHFYMLRLPQPDSARYTDHSTRTQLLTGGEARAGYRQVVCYWSRLTAEEAFVLNNLIDMAEASSGEGNGTLYLTVPKTIASQAGLSWLDVSGTVIRPTFVPIEGTGGRLYQDISLLLTNCTIVNDPSTVM